MENSAKSKTVFLFVCLKQPASTRCSSRVWVLPTSILQRKISRCIYVCIACRRYETSQHAFQNLKIILQSRPSVFKFNLKRAVIFCSGGFCVCIRSKQGELVPTRKFWTWFFTNPASKHLLGFAQTRYSAQNCTGYTFPLIPNKQIFLKKNLFYENRRWFIQYCIKPELSLSVFPWDSPKIHWKSEGMLPKNFFLVMVCFLQTFIEPWEPNNRLHEIPGDDPQVGEPENAAKRGLEIHVGRTAPKIRNHVDSQPF